MSASMSAVSGVRYGVSSSDSWMTFEARSTLHSVQGKATGLGGYVEAAWNADGTLAVQPMPRMHVELLVEQLRSGNGMQDREMWKMVDSKRFPRIAADLRDLQPASSAGRYAASGDVTLAGRSRKYDGEFAFEHDGDSITIEGELNIDIRDFGLKPPSLLIIKVDPLVKLGLHLVAKRAA